MWLHLPFLTRRSNGSFIQADRQIFGMNGQCRTERARNLASGIPCET
jgi:hypothetical protein